MCNVATNLGVMMTALLMSGCMVSCSSSEKEKAENLYAQAEACMN